MKTFRRSLALALSSAVLLGVLSGCGGAPAAGSQPPAADSAQPAGAVVKYSVGSGAMGGVLFVIGSGWANVMNDKLKGQYEFTAEQTGGQSANVSMMETGEVEIGIGGTATLADAYNGQGAWTNGQKYTKARALFTISIPNMTPFTLKGSGITCLQDLDGKRVGLGSKGASIDSTFRAIFDKLGIEPAMIHNDTWSATISALSDGTIDAVIAQQVAPWPSLTELEASKEVELIQMSPEELGAIQELFPFYTPSVIQAGTYKANPDTDIQTLCEWTMMLASADLSEDAVYDIMKTTFDSVDDLTAIHPSMAAIVPENAALVPVTWHPGAVKFYEEMGVKLQEPIDTFVPKG